MSTGLEMIIFHKDYNLKFSKEYNSMVINYMSKYEEFYIYYYELELFDSKDSFIKIVEHPLLYMVKQDLRDLEWQEANPESN